MLRSLKLLGIDMATKKIITTLEAKPQDDSRSSSAETAELDRAPLIRLSKIKEQRRVFSGYRKLMQMVRDGRSVRGRKKNDRAGQGASRERPARLHQQLVAVRLTYKKNLGDGAWRAHGRYLERESAMGREGAERGFGSDGDEVPIAKTLKRWQEEKDPHVFKLIISPQHGSQLDLREYTKAYMARLERDLGTRLQWVGADHYNTDDPHVHVAVRGLDEDGRTLRIAPEFIKGPLREIAGQLATERLGHRTEADIADARERQIGQHRWTDLDRTLKRLGQGGVIDFSTPVHPGATEQAKMTRIALLRRLSTLEGMGLAERGQGGRWTLNPLAESVLRDRQQANDRLKVLHSHRALASDPRLPLASAPADDTRIAGRLIGTGQDDARNRDYLLLESVRGSVVYLYQSEAFEKARRNGLQLGDFMVIKQPGGFGQDGSRSYGQIVAAFGDAEKALTDRKVMLAEVRQHVDRTGAMPAGSVWGGWLGRFHSQLQQEAQSLAVSGVIKQVDGRVVMERPGKTFKRAPKAPELKR